jgi:hypothetical protein
MSVPVPPRVFNKGDNVLYWRVAPGEPDNLKWVPAKVAKVSQ